MSKQNYQIIPLIVNCTFGKSFITLTNASSLDPNTNVKNILKH